MWEHLTISYHKNVCPFSYSMPYEVPSMMYIRIVRGFTELKPAVHILYVNVSFMQTRTEASSTDGLLLKHRVAFLTITDQSSQFNTKTPQDEWLFIYFMVCNRNKQFNNIISGHLFSQLQLCSSALWQHPHYERNIRFGRILLWISTHLSKCNNSGLIT